MCVTVSKRVSRGLMGGQGLRTETEIYLSAYLVLPCRTSGPLATAEGSAPHMPAQPEGIGPWEKGASKPLAQVTSQSGSCWVVTLPGQTVLVTSQVL